MLLYNDWVKECVNHVADSPHIIDRRMATWFELQKMVDEAMTSFGLDDTSSTAPLTESRVQAVLRWFDNRMQDWKKTTPPDLLTCKPVKDVSMETYADLLSASAPHGRVSSHESRGI